MFTYPLPLCKSNKYHIFWMYGCSLSYPAKRIHCIVLSSVVCLVVSYLSTLFHEQQDFLRKVTEHKVCVFIFSNTFVWNISFWEEFSHTLSSMYMGLHVKGLSFLSDFNQTWNFLHIIYLPSSNSSLVDAIYLKKYYMWQPCCYIAFNKIITWTHIYLSNFKGLHVLHVIITSCKK